VISLVIEVELKNLNYSIRTIDMYNFLKSTLNVANEFDGLTNIRNNKKIFWSESEITGNLFSIYSSDLGVDLGNVEIIRDGDMRHSLDELWSKVVSNISEISEMSNIDYSSIKMIIMAKSPFNDSSYIPIPFKLVRN